METNSHYGSNRITRTWVWRSDRVQSILNKTLDTLDDAFWAVDNESLEQEILEAIKIMKGFRDLILEDENSNFIFGSSVASGFNNCGVLVTSSVAIEGDHFWICWPRRKGGI